MIMPTVFWRKVTPRAAWGLETCLPLTAPPGRPEAKGYCLAGVVCGGQTASDLLVPQVDLGGLFPVCSGGVGRTDGVVR